MNNVILCPKCGSDQLTANKKGFSGTKAVGGAILTGGIGLLAGTIGSNKVRITCLSCGFQFRPGMGATSQEDLAKKQKSLKIGEYIALGVGIIIFILIIRACS